MSERAAKTFYVYHLAPTSQEPRWHYGYYSTTLPAQELPDIRKHKPQWIFNEETKIYTTIDPKQYWVKQSRAKRFAERVSTRLKALLEKI